MSGVLIEELSFPIQIDFGDEKQGDLNQEKNNLSKNF